MNGERAEQNQKGQEFTQMNYKEKELSQRSFTCFVKTVQKDQKVFDVDIILLKEIQQPSKTLVERVIAHTCKG